MSRAARATVLTITLLGVLAAALTFVLRSQFNDDPVVQQFREMRGRTEAEVRTTLGAPQRIYEKATAPSDYYEKGYTFERRPIENKVLVYFGNPDVIAYIYFDVSGRVEHVFVGAS